MLLSTSGIDSSITAAGASRNIVTSGNAMIGMPTPMTPLSIPAMTRHPVTAATSDGGAVKTMSASMSATLREPDDAAALRDPLDDVAHVQTLKNRRIAGDEEDRVTVAADRRLSHRRDDACVG